jgi:hypothetical protein
LEKAVDQDELVTKSQAIGKDAKAKTFQNKGRAGGYIYLISILASNEIKSSTTVTSL